MTIDELNRKTQAGFKAVQAEFAAVRAELCAEIKAEGEVTRRHFDIVAEQFKDWTRLLADGTARNTERLDNHETRITTLETEGR